MTWGGNGTGGCGVLASLGSPAGIVTALVRPWAVVGATAHGYIGALAMTADVTDARQTIDGMQ